MAKKVMTAGIYTGHDRAQSTPETITPVDSLEKNVLQSTMPSTHLDEKTSYKVFVANTLRFSFPLLCNKTKK